MGEYKVEQSNEKTWFYVNLVFTLTVIFDIIVVFGVISELDI
jgi:hypothetical protein